MKAGRWLGHKLKTAIIAARKRRIFASGTTIIRGLPSLAPSGSLRAGSPASVDFIVGGILFTAHPRGRNKARDAMEFTFFLTSPVSVNISHDKIISFYQPSEDRADHE
ncbi:MAG TPA: hypothetical protein VF774_00995 [Pseudoduganella sp.]